MYTFLLNDNDFVWDSSTNRLLLDIAKLHVGIEQSGAEDEFEHYD